VSQAALGEQGGDYNAPDCDACHHNRCDHSPEGHELLETRALSIPSSPGHEDESVNDDLD